MTLHIEEQCCALADRGRRMRHKRPQGADSTRIGLTA
ncbi:hypothetical protein DSC45_34755 [Streptomyces sp. YIM 130001]|nr:hypothetical protein DSC45_34755 [Streptomyces sp. YIM 130001]